MARSPPPALAARVVSRDIPGTRQVFLTIFCSLSSHLRFSNNHPLPTHPHGAFINLIARPTTFSKMDIDSPPRVADTGSHAGHTHFLSLPSFSTSFPLPFRVLFLVGLAQLLWAVNLHILHLLGLDTAWILDVRDHGSLLDDIPLLDSDVGNLDIPHSRSIREVDGLRGSDQVGSGKLYQPVYRLFLLYAAWVGGGWIVFRVITGGDPESMESWRWLVGVIAIGASIGALAPWRGAGQRERAALRKYVEEGTGVTYAHDRAIKRILMPPSDAPIFFCDVILADILTSFAKVLGDLWISACQIVMGGITQGRVKQHGMANYLTLAMVW